MRCNVYNMRDEKMVQRWHLLVAPQEWKCSAHDMSLLSLHPVPTLNASQYTPLSPQHIAQAKIINLMMIAY